MIIKPYLGNRRTLPNIAENVQGSTKSWTFAKGVCVCAGKIAGSILADCTPFSEI